MNERRIATWHRWGGLALSIPLVSWIVSAQLLHLVATTAPNGLQGVYELRPFNSQPAELAAAVIEPNALLRTLKGTYDLDRVAWIRLESVGPRLWYVVKPTPYAFAMTLDATTGERLDPLPDSLLMAVAAEKLAGTQPISLRSIDEYHRDYAAGAVPAVEIRMEGDQPTDLILARDDGRTLRRSDRDANTFTWWYRNFHVLQFGGPMSVFTAILYVLTAGVVILAVFGGLLWWKRRPGPRGAVGPPRWIRWHRRMGVAVGAFLIVEVLVGAYMWLSLGPLQDPFRGKQTFNTEWAGGFATREGLAPPRTVLSMVGTGLETTGHPVQTIEWRTVGDRPVWIVRERRSDVGRVFDATTGAELAALPPPSVGTAVRESMAGRPEFEFVGETTYYWMDLNRRIPVYHFRFRDRPNTDVYASAATGQVVSRRTDFWRAFSPFLMIHSMAFTGNKAVDTVVLVLFQAGVLALIVTGWRMHWLVPSPAPAPAARPLSAIGGPDAQV